jgi:hypothetical protein
MLDYIEYYVSLPWMLVVFASLQAVSSPDAETEYQTELIH